MSLIQELRRRNVIRVAALYLIACWLIVQVAETVLPLFNVPDALLRGVVILLAIGFIPALIFSWAYELTPEGIKRESAIDRSASITSQTGQKLNIAIFVMLAALVALMAWERFAPTVKGSGSITTETESADSTVIEPDPFTQPDLSIAVLPFANMSADEENEYFADGLTEELLNMLAQIETLKVAGRTSSFYFKGRNENLQSIGEQLNVAHVLEGSVRKAGDRLRITAQLIKVQDGYHLWSQTYDRQLTDVFAIQEEIAEAIGEALKIQLDLVPEERQGQTDSVEAYTLYLEGRQKWNTRAIEELEEAIALFRRALEIDPDFALAWSGLADAIDALAWRVAAARDLVPEGLEAARRAIELAPDQAAGYASLAVLQSEFMWDFEAAARNYSKALELNPAYAPAMQWYADTLRGLGRVPEALELCGRALELDPLSAIMKSTCASVMFDSGADPRRGIKLWKESISLAPDIVGNRLSLAINARRVGQLSETEATRHLAQYARLRGFPDPDRMLAIVQADGRDEMQPTAAKVIEDLATTSSATAMEIASLYAFIGEQQRALAAIERAYEVRDPQLLYAATWRRFPEELRDHPRFEAVVRKVGLPTRREIEGR